MMQPSAPLRRPHPVSQVLAFAAVLIAAVLLGSPPACADATGFFASAKRRLDVDGTYAFWAKSAAPRGGEVIKVADHLHGEALMRRENGVWLLRDELVSVCRRER